MTVSKANSRDRLVVYGVYTKLIENIQKLDGMQHTYRSIASTLLLACFAVVGFLLALEGEVLSIPTVWNVILIVFLSVTAITAVGLLDLIFIERSLISDYAEALKIERSNAWLPQVHHSMIHRRGHHGSPARKAVYYVGTVGCLIFTCGVAALILAGDTSLHYTIIIGAAVLSFIVIYSIAFLGVTGRFDTKITRLMRSAHLSVTSSIGSDTNEQNLK